jgi:hypothetical protein
MSKNALQSDFPMRFPSRILLPFGVLAYATCLLAALGGGLVSASGMPLVILRGAAAYFVAMSAFGIQLQVGFWIIECLDGAWPKERSGTRAGGETLFFSWVTGFVTTSATLLLLALAGCLQRPILLGGSIALAGVVVYREHGRLAAWLRASHAPTLEVDGSEGRGDALRDLAGGAFLLALFLYWLWPFLAQTLLPNSDWDSALYHLPLATRYLEAQVWSADPLFSAHSFPGAVSLVYAAMMGIGFESAIIPYNFLVVLLVPLGTACLANRLGGRAAGFWALLLCGTIQILWQMGLDPRVDGFLCVFILSAMFALCVWLEDTREPAPLCMLFVSLGGAIGTKYTGVFLSVGVLGLFVLLLLWQRLGDPPRLRAPRSFALLLVALLLLPNSVWYASNLALHGDPLFPMLRGDYYHSPERPGERIPMANALDARLAELAPDSPTRRNARRLRERLDVSAPTSLFDWVDLIASPDRYSVKTNHAASPLLILFLALPLALPGTRSKRLGAWTIYAFGIICFVALGSRTNLVRYVLPLLPLYAVGGGLVLARISHPVWRAFWIGIVFLLLVGMHIDEREKLDRMRLDLYAAEDADALRWLEHVGYNATVSMPVMARRINDEVAAGRMHASDRIMMVGEGKGRRLSSDYLPDLSWFLQRWVVELVLADFHHEEVLASLQRQGITHILYNKQYFAWVLQKTETPIENVTFAMLQLEEFLARYARPTIEIQGMRLFELDRQARSSTQDSSRGPGQAPSRPAHAPVSARS